VRNCGSGKQQAGSASTLDGCTTHCSSSSTGSSSSSSRKHFSLLDL
jgi:hypothetical protein